MDKSSVGERLKSLFETGEISSNEVGAALGIKIHAVYKRYKQDDISIRDVEKLSQLTRMGPLKMVAYLLDIPYHPMAHPGDIKRMAGYLEAKNEEIHSLIKQIESLRKQITILEGQVNG